MRLLDRDLAHPALAHLDHFAGAGKMVIRIAYKVLWQIRRPVRIAAVASRQVSRQTPSNGKQLLGLGGLRQFTLNVRNQFFALIIHLVLSFKQRTPFLITLRFQRLELLLARQFVLECQRSGGGAARFLDLAIEFLDFAFQA